MVTCKKIIAQLSDYLEGSVSADMRERIESHLRGCRHCSAVYDSSRKVLIIMGDKKTFEVPEGYGTRLHLFVDALLEKSRET